jgi:hypothetical protein
MDQKAALTAVHAQLEALQQKIDEQRIRLAQHTDRQAQADQEWRAMVKAHDEIRERVARANSGSYTLVEELRLDLDTLKHAFEKWILKNDKQF